MTQQEKDLLLKDLCARLPYGVKVKDTYYNYDEPSATIWLLDLNTQKVRIYADEDWQSIEYIKPYLFPISSMTEEQKKEYKKMCKLDMEILEKHPMDGSPFPALYNSQDWLDAHNFDYRGLIPMNLAIDATGLNIY